MTQFSLGILSMQNESVFVKRYQKGMTKTEYWEPTLEDAMSLLAKLPVLAAYVYRRSYHGGKHIPPATDKTLDWGANLAHMMGVENPSSRS